MQSNLFIELAEEQQAVVTGGFDIVGPNFGGLTNFTTISNSAYESSISWTGPTSSAGPFGSSGTAGNFFGSLRTGTQNSQQLN